MDDEEQGPIFGQSNRCIAFLILNTRIFNAYERIEEDLTCEFKSDTMLALLDAFSESHTKRWPR